MWILQDAKNKFSAVVEAALTGVPQEVTRRGEPVVVILSTHDYEQLLERAVKQRESFSDHLMGYPASGDVAEASVASGDGRH